MYLMQYLMKCTLLLFPTRCNVQSKCLYQYLMQVWSRPSTTTFEFQPSNVERTKSHKFYWSTDFRVHSTLLKCRSNGLFGWFDVQQQVFPTSHTCVCSCCCKHLVHTRREGPHGDSLSARSLSLSLSSLSGHVCSVKWLESVVCILISKAWRLPCKV